MISGPELATLLGVTRAYIHRLTVSGEIEAEDVSAPGSRTHRFVYAETTVQRLIKDGLPRKKAK